jgi:hypothetical protein
MEQQKQLLNRSTKAKGCSIAKAMSACATQHNSTYRTKESVRVLGALRTTLA